MELNHLENNTIRFIVEDCLKFVKREQRRQRTYHGIIMDPPSYGRGPETRIMETRKTNYMNLLMNANNTLDKDALFFLVNCYTTGFSCKTLEEVLSRSLLPSHPGNIETGESLPPLPTTTVFFLVESLEDGQKTN